MFGSLDRHLKYRLIRLKQKHFCTWFFHLHSVHSSFITSFFVVFAFFLKMGFDWPPNPCCFRSYLANENNIKKIKKILPAPSLSLLWFSRLFILGHFKKLVSLALRMRTVRLAELWHIHHGGDLKCSENSPIKSKKC